MWLRRPKLSTKGSSAPGRRRRRRRRRRLNYINVLCNIISFKEHLPEDSHNRLPKHVAG